MKNLGNIYEENYTKHVPEKLNMVHAIKCAGRLHATATHKSFPHFQ